MTNVAMFCRNCGKALTDQEKAIPGTIVCSACAPAVVSTLPVSDRTTGETPTYTAPPPVADPPGNGVSPGLAFLLGLIPGVGAIYNAQYVKGLVHVFVFGVLISLAGAADRTQPELQPMLVMLTMAWVPYMAFEAYHTAKRRKYGLKVDEFSSVFPLKGSNLAGPAALIGIGVLALLNNLDILRLSQLLRFWPLVLIGLGVYMLYVRMTGEPGLPPAQEVSHDANQ